MLLNKISIRYLGMAYLFILVSACTSSSDKKSMEKYVGNDKLIIHEVLKKVSPEGNQFLVFPKDLCRKCFRKMIDHFEQRKEKGQVVLMGANDYDVQRLNSIYQNSLKFWKGDFEQYDALLSEYPKVIRGYVRYVEINSDTLIYEGIGDDRVTKTEDVLSFFVERDKLNG